MRKQTTTLPVQCTASGRVQAWMSEKCEFLSQLTDCTVSNYAFMCAIVSAVLAAATLVLACDAVQAYGWAALCGMLSVQAAAPMVNEFRKGGNR